MADAHGMIGHLTFVTPQRTSEASEIAKVLKIGRCRALQSTPSDSGREIVFGWFSSQQRHDRRKVRLDRKHLEARTRRFLSGYLTANETRKPQFYRAVEDASKECQPAQSALQSYDLGDAQIAEATYDAAMKIVLARERQSVLDGDDRIAIFSTDAYATVAVGNHRAAGAYTRDSEMQQLGTAAVHLLTMATSYMKTQELSPKM